MNALSRKKKEWEYRNEQFLLEIVATATDVSFESIKKAGRFTSFLAYIMYRLLGAMLAIAFMMFVGPKLVRQVSPEERPEEIEVNLEHLESRIKNSVILR